MKLSIVIPVYNVKDYLERCVASLINQKAPEDYEIILVDDGSSDGSAELCDVLAEKYECVKVSHQKNGGPASARNTGIEMSCGEYIAFADSDDYVTEDYHAVIAEETASSTMDIIAFGLIKMQDGKEMYRRIVDVEKRSYTKEEIIDLILPAAIGAPDVFNQYVIELSACTYVYRREFLMKHHLHYKSERKVLNEDFLFNIEAFIKAENICFTDYYLYCYDTREGSLSMSDHPEVYSRKKALYNAYEVLLKENGLLKQMQVSMDAFWLKAVYECIIQTVWKRSPLSYREKITAIKKYLTDEMTVKALHSYPNSLLDTKGKVIIWLMRHRCCTLLTAGYTLIEKIKSFR